MAAVLRHEKKSEKKDMEVGEPDGGTFVCTFVYGGTIVLDQGLAHKHKERDGMAMSHFGRLSSTRPKK